MTLPSFLDFPNYPLTLCTSVCSPPSLLPLQSLFARPAAQHTDICKHVKIAERGEHARTASCNRKDTAELHRLNVTKWTTQRQSSQRSHDPNISSGLSLKRIPIIIGKFVLAVHWIAEGYQMSAHSAVWTKPQGSAGYKANCLVVRKKMVSL